MAEAKASGGIGSPEGGHLSDDVEARKAVGLKPNPESPEFKVVVLGFTAPGGKDTNGDKATNGVRYDSVPIANGVINNGSACDILEFPQDQKFIPDFVKKLNMYDGAMLRINPGQLRAKGLPADHWDKFDACLNEYAKTKAAWTSPAMQKTLGAKEALVMTRDLPLGLPDTYTYNNLAELEEGFRKTAAFKPRVMKQNRGSSGGGIWKVERKDGAYCEKFGDAALKDDDVLLLKEFNDGHDEEHTVKEFLDFCSGANEEGWKSKGGGGYLKDGGTMVDQRFCPRISEGETRLLMAGDFLVRIEHFKYGDDGGIAGCDTTVYSKDEPKYKELVACWHEQIPKIMDAMGMGDQPLPLIWTGDMIACDNQIGFTATEFNASCVGMAEFYPVMGASLDVIPKDKFDAGMKMADMMGLAAVKELRARKAAAEEKGGK